MRCVLYPWMNSRTHHKPNQFKKIRDRSPSPVTMDILSFPNRINTLFLFYYKKNHCSAF